MPISTGARYGYPHMDLNYAWRSLRLNVTIYLPDELGAWAKEQGINLSAMLRAEIEAGRRSNTADQGDGSPPLIDIAKRRADRLLVLNEIYEAAGGSRQGSAHRDRGDGEDESAENLHAAFFCSIGGRSEPA